MTAWLLIGIGFVIGALVFHPPLRSWWLGIFAQSFKKMGQSKNKTVARRIKSPPKPRPKTTPAYLRKPPSKTKTRVGEL